MAAKRIQWNFPNLFPSEIYSSYPFIELCLPWFSHTTIFIFSWKHVWPVKYSSFKKWWKESSGQFRENLENLLKGCLKNEICIIETEPLHWKNSLRVYRGIRDHYYQLRGNVNLNWLFWYISYLPSAFLCFL